MLATVGLAGVVIHALNRRVRVVVAGIAPALRASRVDPIIALQSE